MSQGKYTFGVVVPPVPPGWYDATFTAFEDKPGSAQMGPGVKVDFTIVDGPEKDKVVSRTFGIKAGANEASKWGQFLSSLNGAALKAGDEVILPKYLGRRYKIQVAKAPQSQGVRVESVMPV